ncbi:RHS repeat domain-containing protein, partial [Aliikangiella maris]
GPNAVRTVMLAGGPRTYGYDENGNLTNDQVRTYTYNALNKPIKIQIHGGTINEALDTQATSSGHLAFFYGADQMRYKQVKTAGNGETTTHYYIGQTFEKVIKRDSLGSVISEEQKSYIDDVAVLTEKQQGATTFEITYFHRDRLGSMTAEIDDSGNMIRSHSFDAFGRPRNENLSDKSPLQQMLGASTNRGFTGHEQLDEAQLTHMNGRVYDYNLGRFLSVDPFIQEPGNSQSMNPYSYIMNNPMAGTDPSGYAGSIPSPNPYDMPPLEDRDLPGESCQRNIFCVGANSSGKQSEPENNGNTGLGEKAKTADKVEQGVNDKDNVGDG